MAAVAELISPQEYLAFERTSETKHEYINGQMIETVGATEVHNTIVGNVIFTLGSQLRGRAGKVYPSDMRVKIPATGMYTYPDVTVIADQPLLEDEERDVLLNPAVIIEVLSRSTERLDRGLKFQRYRTIETLAEHLLIAQDSHRVEHYVRQDDGQWLLSEAALLSETIHLPTVNCDLPLAEVYDDVDIRSNDQRLNGHPIQR